MKLLPLLSVGSSTQLVSGAFIPRSSSNHEFSIVHLSAEVIPHDSTGSYFFNLASDPQVIPTTCQASPSTNNALVDVPQTPCSDPRYSWSWTVNDGDGSADVGFWFEYAGGSFRRATHHIPADEIVWTNKQSPTGTVQKYEGPVNFTAPVE